MEVLFRESQEENCNQKELLPAIVPSVLPNFRISEIK
jgi:hypothetical protein